MTEQNGVGRSSAAGELRRLLDKRGVEWSATDTHRLLVTSWNDFSGHSWAYMEHRDGSFSKLTAYHLTPEQAVAATLGPGTCHNVNDTMKSGEIAFRCSECGAWDENPRPLFCHGCGKEVTGK